MCEMCLAIGIVEQANVVDHKTPHKGNTDLFHDPNNLQSLSKRCHDSVKQSQERTGHLKGSDIKGVPLDANHHWNTGGRG